MRVIKSRGVRSLVAGDGLPVDIALETGFADQAHFSRMFKSAFGMSPMRYCVLSAKEGGDL
ncbi:hypothetical protein C2W62_33235 [Candidatus Entotheonella serta]|nr:hypothetical protein C2W62_33235 [Candidatus Entotheonella serta]